MGRGVCADRGCAPTVVRTFGVLPEGRRKWTKGVLGPDGRIYCSPLCAPSVLVIDPASGSAWTIGSLEAYEDGRFLWAQGVVGLDHKIYCAPLSASGVLVIDPMRGTASVLDDCAL